MIPTHKRFPVIVVDYTRAPHLAPRDDLSAARGIAVGVLLAVPVWCCIAGIVWWAWASGAVRS